MTTYTMRPLDLELGPVELHSDLSLDEGAVIRARFDPSLGSPGVEFFPNIEIAEAIRLLGGEPASEEFREVLRRVVRHYKSVDPEIIEAVGRLPWYKDLQVEESAMGCFNLSGNLVGDDNIYFLAGNEWLEVCLPPCKARPWGIGFYNIDGEPLLSSDWQATTVAELVYALDELARKYFREKITSQ